MDLSQLTAEQRTAIARLSKDLPFFATQCLKIVDKQGRLVPFVFNQAQHYIHQKIEQQKRRTGRVRAIIIKGRQEGCTTYTQGRYFHATLFQTHQAAYILAHQAESTLKIFSMTSRFYDNLPEMLKCPRSKDTEKSMTLEQGSSYTVGTAGSSQVGRGMTVQLFHGCLEGETLVVLASGRVKKIKDIQPGDMVRTHTGVLAPVTFSSKTTQECVDIKVKGLQGFPLVASLRHRFLTDRGWLEARELRVGDKIAHAVPQITGQVTSLPFALPVEPAPHHDRRPLQVPERIELTYELGRVLGLYLAEGCINGQGKLNRLFRTTFAVHEREAERTLAWLRPFEKHFTKATARPRKDSKTVAVEVYGRAFAELLAKCCGRKEEKGLPVYWAQWPEACLKGVLHGYLSGDGHAEAKTRRISAPSIRAAITTQMRDIAAALGYGWASMAYNPPAIRQGRNEQAQYVFRLTGSGVDRLCPELGWTTTPRKRVGEYGDIRIEVGAAWLPILSITDAGKKEVFDLEIGHADHTYHTIHGVSHNSEVAFYENTEELSTGLMQTVADLPGTEMILESTANGPGNFFYNKVMQAAAGKGDFELIFVPWYWMDEYAEHFTLSENDLTDKEREMLASHKDDPIRGMSIANLAWRRKKIIEFEDKEWKFQQEYPCNVQEAFIHAEERFFDLKKLYAAKARKARPDRDKPLILGVDQGRTGDDTEIARRQANVIFPLETIPADDGQERDMRLAGRIARIIEAEQPDQVFVDTTNEHGAVDRLHELGYKKIVKGVHFGAQATDPSRVRNKRTEMHLEFREWLTNDDSSIPDDQKLMSECGAIPKEKETSNNLQYLVGKDIIKSDLGWSPNKLDAIILTFAYPVRKRQVYQGTIAQRPQNDVKKAGLKPQMSTMKGVR
jgi:hypothetical protein